MRYQRVIPELRKLAADPHVDLYEAAQRLGISVRSVRRYCQRLGIKWVRRYKLFPTLRRNIEIYNKWRLGARIVDLANEYNLSPSRIVHIIVWSRVRINTIPAQVLERWINVGNATNAK